MEQPAVSMETGPETETKLKSIKLESASGSASGFSFPRNYRLTKTDEFSSVFDFRRAIKSPCFALNYRPRIAEEEGVARLGVIIAKRLLRRSVDRNQVRRLVREQFRLLHRHLPAHDFVLRLMRRPDSLSKLALATEIKSVLTRLIPAEHVR